MHLLTIIWTLFCATLIMGYPLYLLHKSSTFFEESKHYSNPVKSGIVELISFEVSHYLPGWSFRLDVPQITEEVIQNYPILFYLESSESCLKLPLNNGALGYTANIYKNVGRVYVTFKSLTDGVSNFYIPSWHLSKLKILIIKPSDLNGQPAVESKKSTIYKSLQKAKININNYEEVITYLSNITTIAFKGYTDSRNSKEMQSNNTSEIYSAI